MNRLKSALIKTLTQLIPVDTGLMVVNSRLDRYKRRIIYQTLRLIRCIARKIALLEVVANVGAAFRTIFIGLGVGDDLGNHSLGDFTAQTQLVQDI